VDLNSKEPTQRQSLFFTYEETLATESFTHELKRGNRDLRYVLLKIRVLFAAWREIFSVFVSFVIFPYCDFSFWEREELGSRLFRDSPRAQRYVQMRACPWLQPVAGHAE
jgi:hypothetical protein